MNDLISRQDAIDAIDKYNCCGWVEEEMDKLESVINNLPPAEPEEVVPHRNYKYLSDYWCECGNHLGKKGDVVYCSDCGRKVKWDE